MGRVWQGTWGIDGQCNLIFHSSPVDKGREGEKGDRAASVPTLNTSIHTVKRGAPATRPHAPQPQPHPE